MISSHLEKIIFHTIIDDAAYIESVTPRYFDDPILKKLFPIVKEFNEKYRQVPSVEQLKEIVKLKSLESELTQGQIEAAWDVKLKDYEADWLKETTQTFIEYSRLNLSAQDLVMLIKSTTINSDNIKDIVQKAKNLIMQQNSLDFNFNEGSDFFDATTHRQPTYNTFSTGYPYMDQVANGGFSAKTLTVFLGQPKVGKSLWLANIAASSVMMGHNTAIVTLEMAEPVYIKRLGANLLNIKMDEYKKVSLDTATIKSKIGNLLGAGGLVLPGKLIVKEYPTSTASVPDIESFLLKVEEKKGIKFKMVVIDYINILKNWRNANTENLYMKIKQIAEDLRAMAQRNCWAVVTATQVNKSFYDGTDMTMGAASESSALAATVDLMFGIIQDPTMYADGVNGRYKLKTLANRDEGFKNSAKIFLVEYPYMRIKEDPHTGIIPGGLN